MYLCVNQAHGYFMNKSGFISMFMPEFVRTLRTNLKGFCGHAGGCGSGGGSNISQFQSV